MGEYISRQEETIPDEMEIDEIISNLKNKKSPGNDEITAEMFKYTNKRLKQNYATNNCKNLEKMLKDWLEATLYPIYEKGIK